ncbi:MAG: hypothetical protein QOG69_2995 [Actinomycetota bacterium]|jgi:hypothetical protein|nr:hypothetical protein [Actinomycetota bacterium]
MVALAAMVLAGAVEAPATLAGAPPPPKVTLIGDSVMTGVYWDHDAIAIMQNGLDVNWQVAVCRRLEGVSCPFEGSQAPVFVDLVHMLGPQLAPTVVVEMGYNDFEQTFAQSVDDSIRALRAEGVKRILWLTLREVRHPYTTMNDILAAAALRHPQMTLVDWNMYSRSHPDWFQNDGEHLEASGGLAMAALIHAAVMKALIPVSVVPRNLPVAHVGRRYAARLVATGGMTPYDWRLVSGSLPKGLRLTPDGLIVGVPQKPARVSLVVRAADSSGETATSREALAVLR